MRELKANDIQKISGGEFTAEHGIAGGINGGYWEVAVLLCIWG